MYNIDKGVRQLQAIVVDRSINLHLLPVHVCIESNLLVTCLQLYQSWNTVDNPERVGRKQLQLPSTVRSLPSYVKWMIHHAEQDIRTRNPPTPLSAMISKPLSRVQLYEESRHTRIQSLKISPVNLSISLALGSQFMSSSYDYFTIQDLKCVFPQISIDERYPRRISYVLSQLLSTYRKSLLFSLLYRFGEQNTWQSLSIRFFLLSEHQNVGRQCDYRFVQSHIVTCSHAFLCERVYRCTDREYISVWNRCNDGFHKLALHILPTSERFSDSTHAPWRNHTAKSLHQIKKALFLVWKAVESEFNIDVVYDRNDRNGFASSANGSLRSPNNATLS